jgi:RNA polymerase sigma-70 factor (ECF subfamily)
MIVVTNREPVCGLLTRRDVDTPVHCDDERLRDRECIARSMTEPAAFAIIFERHFTVIHRYLARRAGRDAADDLASEVFTIAFSRRADFNPAYESALPWLYGIGGNLLHANRRRAKRDQALLVRSPEPEAPTPFEEPVDRSLDARRRFQGLEGRLRRLSPGDRDALLLYAWEDLSYPEIAAALEIPIGTVRSRLHRVRRKLREPEELERARTSRQQAEPGKGEQHG